MAFRGFGRPVFCFGTHILKTNVGSELVGNFILCFLSDMGIDVHRSLDVLMPQSFLDFFDGSTGFKEQGAVGVAETVRCDAFEVWVFPPNTIEHVVIVNSTIGLTENFFQNYKADVSN